MQPEDVVARLSALFSGFDVRAQQHGLEKIKTIGDAYMLVGGAPEVQTDHAETVSFAWRAISLPMLGRWRRRSGRAYSSASVFIPDRPWPA